MFLSLASFSGALPGNLRSVTPLRDGWSCDGESVTLPHTWNAVDAADGEGRAENWAQEGYSSGARSYERKVALYTRRLPPPKNSPKMSPRSPKPPKPPKPPSKPPKPLPPP